MAAGPDGSNAVDGSGEGSSCSELTKLLVIRPDGAEQRHRLAPRPPQAWFPGTRSLTWGASGLLALSCERPTPLALASSGGGAKDGRITPASRAPELVDPTRAGPASPTRAAAELVASLDGEEGVAWSPDGTGLLVARRDGPRASELAVAWGPRLRERRPVGRPPRPVVPQVWTAA